jgi:hypothetical protein
VLFMWNAQTNRAYCFVNKKMFLRATGDYTKLLSLDVDNKHALFNRGLSKYELGDLTGSIEVTFSTNVARINCHAIGPHPIDRNRRRQCQSTANQVANSREKRQFSSSDKRHDYIKDAYAVNIRTHVDVGRTFKAKSQFKYLQIMRR